MPHIKMQDYVNIDYRQTLSIVGLIGKPGEGRIIAEGRYVCLPDRPYADLAFVVDEVFQGKGIATYLFEMLIEIAKDKGLKGFEADVLADNRPMLKVLKKIPYPYQAILNAGVYKVTIHFSGEYPSQMSK